MGYLMEGCGGRLTGKRSDGLGNEVEGIWAFSRRNRVCETPVSEYSPLPMDTHDPRRVTSTLPASWVGIGYPMKRASMERATGSFTHWTKCKKRKLLLHVCVLHRNRYGNMCTNNTTKYTASLSSAVVRLPFFYKCNAVRKGAVGQFDVGGDRPGWTHMRRRGK
ncbi:hypothetical protein EVAR_11882_1 [Eumeta japonica]|uniref:Uncharacterized protein n=1 Tax=Eumeta variegata TaxID=151549 RepID=A0A4C1U8Z9_EUMVA|nr:hypothetical protein EVAR_11882_1 [Eumeta japonica]